MNSISSWKLHECIRFRKCLKCKICHNLCGAPKCKNLRHSVVSGDTSDKLCLRCKNKSHDKQLNVFKYNPCDCGMTVTLSHAMDSLEYTKCFDCYINQMLTKKNITKRNNHDDLDDNPQIKRHCVDTVVTTEPETAVNHTVKPEQQSSGSSNVRVSETIYTCIRFQPYQKEIQSTSSSSSSDSSSVSNEISSKDSSIQNSISIPCDNSLLKPNTLPSSLDPKKCVQTLLSEYTLDAPRSDSDIQHTEDIPRPEQNTKQVLSHPQLSQPLPHQQSSQSSSYQDRPSRSVLYRRYCPQPSVRPVTPQPSVYQPPPQILPYQFCQQVSPHPVSLPSVGYTNMIVMSCPCCHHDIKLQLTAQPFFYIGHP